jgi:glycosyltransferase involved in cell wall biosynthesis
VSSETHSLLLLVPAYNEADRIEPVLRAFATYYESIYPGRFKMVAVLNGCTDNTAEVVSNVSEDFPTVSMLDFPGRIGKGGALIEGLKLAPLADLIGYVDADGATSPEAFHELVKKVDQHDCVIGSRWLPDSVLHQSQSSKRQFASRVFHLIVRTLFRMPFKDTQCGAKVMKRDPAASIQSSLTIADMAFDINLLFLLRREGFDILETPTEWTDKIGSKVQLGKNSLVMLLSVIRLRLIYSPFHFMFRPLRPLETWIYKTLSAPPPLRRSKENR